MISNSSFSLFLCVGLALGAGSAFSCKPVQKNADGEVQLRNATETTARPEVALLVFAPGERVPATREPDGKIKPKGMSCTFTVIDNPVPANTRPTSRHEELRQRNSAGNAVGIRETFLGIAASHCVSKESSNSFEGLWAVFPQVNTEPEMIEIDTWQAQSEAYVNCLHPDHEKTSRCMNIEQDKSKSRDIMLVRLRRKPNTRLTPARISTRAPEPKESLTVFGFGCHAMVGNLKLFDFQKRSYVYDPQKIGMPGESVLCPGDSGGPVFRPNGELVYINSGRFPVPVEGYQNMIVHKDVFVDLTSDVSKPFLRSAAQLLLGR